MHPFERGARMMLILVVGTAAGLSGWLAPAVGHGAADSYLSLTVAAECANDWVARFEHLDPVAEEAPLGCPRLASISVAP